MITSSDNPVFFNKILFREETFFLIFDMKIKLLRTGNCRLFFWQDTPLKLDKMSKKIEHLSNYCQNQFFL